MSGKLRSVGGGNNLTSFKRPDGDSSEIPRTPLRFSNMVHARCKDHRTPGEPPATGITTAISTTNETLKPPEYVQVVARPRYHFGCLLRNSLPPMPPGLIARVNMNASRGPLALYANNSSLPAVLTGNVSTFFVAIKYQNACMLTNIWVVLLFVSFYSNTFLLKLRRESICYRGIELIFC